MVGRIPLYGFIGRRRGAGRAAAQLCGMTGPLIPRTRAVSCVSAWAVAVCAGAIALALAGAAPGQTPAAPQHVIRIDAGQRRGPANRDLAGVGWNTGELSRIAPYHPPLVRIDALIDRVSPAPGRIDLDEVLAHVAAVHRIG